MNKTCDLERGEKRYLKEKRTKKPGAKSKYLSSFVLLQKENIRTDESV